MQQLHHHRETIVEAHGILGHLGVLVAGGQVTQGADGGLGDVFSVASPKHRPHQGLDASNLTRTNTNKGVVIKPPRLQTHTHAQLGVGR